MTPHENRPPYLVDTEQVVYDLLEPLLTDRGEHDRYIDAIVNAMKVAKHWGFVFVLSIVDTLSAAAF